MIKFEFDWQNMPSMGWPKDIRHEVSREVYNHHKQNKPPQEFKCTVERSLEYVNKFLA